jgi:hypothetical protein
MTFVSSCHCGAITATVDEELPRQGMTCNCSICRRKGNIHHFTTPDKVTFTRPEGLVAEYTFHHGNIRHQFCMRCGCSPFAEGHGPQGPMVEINLRCVGECDPETLEITRFDGAAL